MAISTPTSFWNMSSTADELGVNTLTNTGGVTFTTGFIGNASNFDGANKRLGVSNSLGYSSSSTNTWAFMIRPDTVGGSRYFLDIGVASSRRIILYQNGTDLRFYCSGTDTSTGITLSASTWYRIVITHNSGSFAVYVDNVLKISPTSGATGSSSTFFSIGAPGDGFTANMVGLVDAFGLWSIVLSGSEITELYNSGNWKEYPFSLTSSNKGFLTFL